MAPRTIVVGAGVVGLSVAERLSALGEVVTLVDRGAPGSGTSRTSFGWINSNGKAPRSYHDLNVDAVAAYRRLAADPSTADWLHLNGRLQWADSAAEIEALEASAEAMRSWDYPVEAMTVDAARRLEPDLVIPDGAEVRFWATEGFVIPPLYVAWLLARATSRRVRVATGQAVTVFRQRGGAVNGVILEDGSTLEADRVVVCVGRWTQAVLSLLDVRIPMLPTTAGSPTVGLLGYTSDSRTDLTRTVTRHSISVRPDAPRGRYVLQGHGLDHLADPAVEPDPGGAVGLEILARARQILAGFDRTRLDELRIGYRAVPADRLTVAGWAPGVKNLYVVATHSGYTLARHLGELAAREVALGADEGSLSDLRPARFGGPGEPAAADARAIH